MNVEEILAALQAILDGANDRELTDEEVERYEQLEGKLETRRKRDEIEKTIPDLPTRPTAKR